MESSPPRMFRNQKMPIEMSIESKRRHIAAIAVMSGFIVRSGQFRFCPS